MCQKDNEAAKSVMPSQCRYGYNYGMVEGARDVCVWTPKPHGCVFDYKGVKRQVSP